MISAAERKHRQRERILDMYRKNYAKPFWDAYKDGSNAELQRLCNMSYAFKLGVCMTAPHSRYYEAFNRIDKEFKKEIIGDD